LIYIVRFVAEVAAIGTIRLTAFIDFMHALVAPLPDRTASWCRFIKEGLGIIWPEPFELPMAWLCSHMISGRPSSPVASVQRILVVAVE
jgi:hypothetical protein